MSNEYANQDLGDAAGWRTKGLYVKIVEIFKREKNK